MLANYVFRCIIKRMSNHVIQMPNLLSVSEFQRAPGKALKRLQKSQTPIIITQRGKPVAILSTPEQGVPTMTPATPASARREELLAALQKMLPKIISVYKPEKIILFGSLAT